MSDLNRQKLANILGLLASDHAGERAAAAAKAAALVRGAGLTWTDVLLPPETSAATDEDLERVFSAGYEKGLTEARAAATSSDDWARAGQARSDELNEKVSEVLEICTAADDEFAVLNPRERDFLSKWPDTIAQYNQRAYCSEAQWRWLMAIKVKLQRQGLMA